jgi:hypothetical protein
MKGSRLLGVVCIGVIVLVSASTNANDPLASGLLHAVFIISCGVLGVLLLRKANLNQTLVVRQRGSRRFDLPVEFPLEDSQGVIMIKNRRRLPDRRKEIYGFDDLKAILSSMSRKKAA